MNPRNQEVFMTDAPPAAIYIRLNDELQERLDRYLARLRKQQPGFRLTRSDAVRDLMSKGLDVVEQDEPEKS
jgi:hypothetical protein